MSSISNIVQRLFESRINEADSYEYKFDIPWREAIVNDYDEVYIYNPRQMDYADSIMDAAKEDFNDANLAQYARKDSRTADLNISDITMDFDPKGNCIVSVITNRILNDEDIENVINYLEGQMSDGWGEGFEQREIAEYTDYNEEWVEDDEDEDGGYYEEVRTTVYIYGQFWWSDKPSHPYGITLVRDPHEIGERSNESLGEAEESEYHRLKKTYPKSASFKDIDKESGSIRDLTDELDNKGISYEIYKDKTDKGCTVFYEKGINESKVNTYINPEDKVSISKLKSSIKDYPVGTYIRYATKGNINAMNNNTYGLLKTGDDEWSPYSSFLGAMNDKVYTTTEVLATMAKRGAKNIGVKLSK